MCHLTTLIVIRNPGFFGLALELLPGCGGLRRGRRALFCPAFANLGLQRVTLVCGEAFIAAVSGPEAIGGYDSEVICSARTQVR